MDTTLDVILERKEIIDTKLDPANQLIRDNEHEYDVVPKNEKHKSGKVHEFTGTSASKHITPLDKMLAACCGALLTSLFNPRIPNQTSTLSCTAMIPSKIATGHQLNGFLDGINKIVRYEGITSLWRGLSPGLVMSIPLTVVYFVGYDSIRDSLWKHWKGKYSELYSPLLAGTLARTISVSIISPIELLRTRMQGPEGVNGLKDVMNGVQRMVRINGISSLWRGLEPTLWRDVPFSAIYWTGYESIKRNFSNHLRNKSIDGNINNFAVAFTSGATSGMIAATLTTPFDVAKTRRQVASHSSGALRIAKVAIFISINPLYFERSHVYVDIMTSHLLEQPQIPKVGFNFDNYRRNAFLEKKGLTLPKATKTGTTIIGVHFKDGIVLGADTRSTNNDVVANKNCEKIHYLAPNMYCGGAGTAADLEFTTALISSQLELHRLSTGREARVQTAVIMAKQKLFRYQGHIGAALIVGGFDVTGPSLHNIHPHGSSDRLQFVAMGSGSLAAMAILESRWTKNMERDDAIELAKDAIEAGIFNDLGSGSNVDLCIIEKDKIEMLRNYSKPNERVEREKSYKYKRGTT
ncbi:7602_t:CDS:10, partial [Scutellospora calospora]